MGACFACSLANQWRNHYQNTTDPKKYSLPINAESWSCAGGDEPPKACPNRLFTNSPDWSECICKDRTYRDPANATNCLVCPAGSYCVNDKKTQCADHYYQSDTGQTACTMCASTPDKNGMFNVCEANRQLQMCLQSNPETQSRALRDNCVVCSKCKKLYSTVSAGQVDCYRSYRGGAG